MKKHILDFYEKENNVESIFNTLLLFGKNVSTYKFALCTTLLKNEAKSFITYDELTNDFVKEFYKHYSENPYQFTIKENTLTRTFDEYETTKNWEKVISIARKNIFNDVLDRFHNVGGSSIKEQHLLYEHDKKGKRLILRDNLNSILEQTKIKLQIENVNQSRWNIVEEAWKAKLSPNLLVYDKDGNIYSKNNNERKNLRSAVNVLLPYQNNKCFYCNKKINVFTTSNKHDFPDVDHLIPHSFFKNLQINADGIWNLVIACKECNRGANGKFDTPPSKLHYNNLIKRNILFSEEHKHSLKNSVLLSLNLQLTDSKNIHKQMNSIYNNLNLSIIKGWSPKLVLP